MLREVITAMVLGFAAPASVFAQGPDKPLVGHVIRLGFGADANALSREASVRTFNRFKQIKGPALIVVGRDVSVADGFEYAQITTFQRETDWRNYFYDPIHVAADREAETLNAISRGASFDIFPDYRPAEAAALVRINSDRAERFRLNDDRPTSPPVPDRPQDQAWPFGNAFFYVVRFSGAPMMTFDRLMNAAQDQVVSGRMLGGAQPDKANYGAVIRFADETAWRDFARSPAMMEARAAGLYREGSYQAFFVIDPVNDALAERLRAGLTEG